MFGLGWRGSVKECQVQTQTAREANETCSGHWQKPQVMALRILRKKMLQSMHDVIDDTKANNITFGKSIDVCNLKYSDVLIMILRSKP